MLTVPAAALASLRPWFTPERPGPMIYEHVARTGFGRCRVDRWPDPRVVLAELPGPNVALRGDPSGPVPAGLPGVAGYVEAPPEWLPRLREVDPVAGVWDRVIAALPADRDVPASGAEVRLLVGAHAAALATMDPACDWIHETWGGAAGLAAAGVARAVFVDGRPVSVAVPFYVGGAHEDIGVGTEPGHRGRGYATAVAGALVTDIRARGRQPTWSTTPDNAASLAVAARLGFTQVRDDLLYVVRTSTGGRAARAAQRSSESRSPRW